MRVTALDSSGQVIPDAPNTGLFYVYRDHLGSIAAMSDNVGDYISGSLALFRPFGAYRLQPTTNPDITDRGYTGHRQNNTGSYDIGLIYMNARYYVAEIGRFASADIIVPDPNNPQSFNRYSYVLNSPLKFYDPSGHAECATYDCKIVWHPKTGNVIVRRIDNPLYRLIAQVAYGQSTAKNRLNQILSETQSQSISRAFGHFRGVGSLRGDAGFQAELKDDHLYRDLWNIETPASKQVGHFLSAVSMGQDNGIEKWLWLYAIVRHEQYSDGRGKLGQLLGLTRQAVPIERYELSMTVIHIQWFLKATALDATGEYAARDQLLRDILSPYIYGDQSGRIGNSLEDLRLSVRGWRLGNLVANGGIQTNSDLANWLVLYVAQ